MTRSRRKTPITGITVGGTNNSEKWDKQKANRRLRRHVKTALETEGAEAEAELLPELREVSNVWTMYKDGKHWHGNDKDKPWYKEMLRK